MTDTSKMRSEFEAWYAKEFAKTRGYEPTAEEMVSMREGDGYGCDRGYLNGCWKGWQASRQAVVVELPGDDGMDGHLWAPDVVSAIEAQGLRCEVRS